MVFIVGLIRFHTLAHNTDFYLSYLPVSTLCNSASKRQDSGQDRGAGGTDHG